MTAEHMNVPCIICDKVLSHVFDLDDHNQPDDGICCQAYGQYGSTAFDPMDGSHLEFNICDECLVKKASAGVVLIGRAIYENSEVVGFEKPKVWRGPKQYQYHIEAE